VADTAYIRLLSRASGVAEPKRMTSHWRNYPGEKSVSYKFYSNLKTETIQSALQNNKEINNW